MTTLSLSETLGVSEAAEYLAVSPRTVVRYASERKIPHFKPCGRLRFRQRDLDEFIQSSWVEAVA